ncbi:MAG: hypothetical protein IK140_08210 [Clostridia bacterium]|nr:hypothetical protein [Clostridia bacterium]
MLPGIFPLLFIVLISWAVSSLKKASQQAKKAQPNTPPRRRVNTGSAAPASGNGLRQESRPAASFPRSEFMGDGSLEQPFETDLEGFDSQQEFHEGEDPCHDEMETVSEPTSVPEAETGRDDMAQRLLEGVVFSEILGRRKKRI